MTTRITKVMTTAEFTALEDEGVAKGFYRNDPRVLTPGMAWFQDFYFDPTGEREKQDRYVIYKLEDRGKLGFLSSHYWRDWSHIRPPICVVCPNGEQWEIDRKSSNGEGWQVTCPDWQTNGFLNLTCHPSIVVEGYHGWLRNGQFTEDIEGRGPVGIPRKMTGGPA